MKTLSPAVITLPWRQDAAEFYFSRLSHLPWAMLLHSGYADHPYSRFDIVVADPISFCRIWQWVSTIGRSLSTTSVIQFLC